MIEKVNLKQLLFVGIACMAINIVFVGCGKSATIDQLQSDTDRNLGRIKAEQSSVGVELDRSQTASNEVKESLDRINTNINDGRARINEIKESINAIEHILAECEGYARESKNIIERIDGAN